MFPLPCSIADLSTIQYVAEQYRIRHPDCLVWQVHNGHQLWSEYPLEVQREIQQALADGRTELTIEGGATLNFAGRLLASQFLHLISFGNCGNHTDIFEASIPNT